MNARQATTAQLEQVHLQTVLLAHIVTEQNYQTNQSANSVSLVTSALEGRQLVLSSASKDMHVLGGLLLLHLQAPTVKPTLQEITDNVQKDITALLEPLFHLPVPPENISPIKANTNVLTVLRASTASKSGFGI